MTTDAAHDTHAPPNGEYLERLHVPDAAERSRISQAQTLKEDEIEGRYRTQIDEVSNAATMIQKAYRGHRKRRQLDGLSLTPSSRWEEAIRWYRYTNATSALNAPVQDEPNEPLKSPSVLAQSSWRRAGQIAQYASAGDSGHITADEKEPPMLDSLLLDMRYWLELVDTQHRYGTNLQMYHEEWQRSRVDQNFFYWLDRGDGRGLSLPLCDRAKLDKERIRYLSKEERKDYLVQIDGSGKLRWEKNGELISTNNQRFQDSFHGIIEKQSAVQPSSDEQPMGKQLEILSETEEPEQRDRPAPTTTEPADDKLAGAHNGPKTTQPHQRLHVSPATILNHLMRATVKPGTWIYVADTVGRLFVGIKSSGAFQHTSFLAGARISSAGLIGIEDGQLTYLSPLSGHYRPTTKSFKLFVDGLKRQHVDLSRLRVSSAYKVLLATEYYSRTKVGVGRVLHPGRKDDKVRRKSPEPTLAQEALLSATSTVDQHWEEEHRRGLAKLMDDLHIRRRSVEQDVDR